MSNTMGVHGLCSIGHAMEVCAIASVILNYMSAMYMYMYTGLSSELAAADVSLHPGIRHPLYKVYVSPSHSRHVTNKH